MNFEMVHQIGVYAVNIYFPATKNCHLFDQQLVAPFGTRLERLRLRHPPRHEPIGAHSNQVRRRRPAGQLRHPLYRFAHDQ